jgi:hypothetical protein
MYQKQFKVTELLHPFQSPQIPTSYLNRLAIPYRFLMQPVRTDTDLNVTLVTIAPSDWPGEESSGFTPTTGIMSTLDDDRRRAPGLNLNLNLNLSLPGLLHWPTTEESRVWVVCHAAWAGGRRAGGWMLKRMRHCLVHGVGGNPFFFFFFDTRVMT